MSFFFVELLLNYIFYEPFIAICNITDDNIIKSNSICFTRYRMGIHWQHSSHFVKAMACFYNSAVLLESIGYDTVSYHVTLYRIIDTLFISSLLPSTPLQYPFLQSRSPFPYPCRYVVSLTLRTHSKSFHMTPPAHSCPSPSHLLILTLPFPSNCYSPTQIIT